jgi:hypothetical protein
VIEAGLMLATIRAGLPSAQPPPASAGTAGTAPALVY